jgi:hypothetical protein
MYDSEEEGDKEEEEEEDSDGLCEVKKAFGFLQNPTIL